MGGPGALLCSSGAPLRSKSPHNPFISSRVLYRRLGLAVSGAVRCRLKCGEKTTRCERRFGCLFALAKHRRAPSKRYALALATSRENIPRGTAKEEDDACRKGLCWARSCESLTTCFRLLLWPGRSARSESANLFVCVGFITEPCFSLINASTV